MVPPTLWIQNFLSNRTRSVLVEGVSSSDVFIVCGVPQGSVYSVHASYYFYINDIADGLKSTVCLFADLTIKSDQDAREFQKDLDKLTEWMMEIHPEKT